MIHLQALKQILSAYLLMMALGQAWCHAAPGDVDTLDVGIADGIVFATTPQPDGKTIIAGSFNSVQNVARTNIARLNADGTLDVGFSPAVNNTIYSVTLQNDGKILIGGSFTYVGQTSRKHLVRLNIDGTLDTGFNPDLNNIVLNMVLQPDGRILLGGGFTTVSGNTRNHLARLETDGSLDQNFNPNLSSWPTTMILQNDGKILIGGWFNSVGGIGRSHIARLATDGSVDMGFSPSAESTIFCLGIEADGSILMGGGFTQINGIGRNRMARVSRNGVLDNNFNPNLDKAVYSMSQQADGSILLGGEFTMVGGTTRNHVAKISNNGAADTSFNPNVNQTVYCLTQQNDGKVLIGGNFTQIGTTARKGFAQLLNNPSTQTLSVEAGTRVLWTREGSAPDVSRPSFELSIDGGSQFTPLSGEAVRVGSSANWQLEELNLPESGIIRARGRTFGGYRSNSSGLVDYSANFGLYAEPVISYVARSTGSTSGGTRVLINGHHLTGATAVTFGNIAAAKYTVLSATQILAETPAMEEGIVSVAVSTPGGTTAPNTFFRYVQPPMVGSIFPTSGSIEGGTHITIIGFNFSGATSVTIGGKPAASFAVLSDTQITAITAARVAGVASILVTTPGETNETNALFRYFIPNDDFANRIVLPSQPTLTTQGTNVGATKEPGEPNHWANTGSSSVWWTWTAPSSGLFIFKTNLSSFRAITAIYTGSSLDTLNLVGNNNDITYSDYTHSRLVLNAREGTNYQIAVDGNALNEGGLIKLSITAVKAPEIITSSAKIIRSARNMYIQYKRYESEAGEYEITFSPAGSGTYYGSSSQTSNFEITDRLIIRNLSGLTVGPLYATVKFAGISSGPPVQVATVVESGVGDPDFFDIDYGYGATKSAVLQPDGKVIALDDRFGNLARFNADGSYDTSFQYDQYYLTSVALKRDGKILMGGWHGLVQLSPNGSHDAGFNANVSGRVDSISIQKDERILIGGNFTSIQGEIRNRIARLMTDGLLDQDFNPDVNDWVSCIAVQEDGKILLGGNFTSISGKSRHHIARLSADGTLDESFNASVNMSVNCIAIQADGKVLVGGQFTSVNGTLKKAIARLMPNGALDNSFDLNLDDAQYRPLTIYSMVIQADGKILFGGMFDYVEGMERRSIARLMPDGRLDGGFSANALISPDFGGEVNGLSLQSDGKILVCGRFELLNGDIRRNFARLYNDPAEQMLTVRSSRRIIWSRGGSTPEITQPTFEISTDDGTTYSPLSGTSMRIANTANWQFNGINLPKSGKIRATGRTIGGHSNNSSSLIQQVMSYTNLDATPDIEVAQETPLTNDQSVVSFTTELGHNSDPLSFSITNPGDADLSHLKISNSGPDSSDFIVSPLSTTYVPSASIGATFKVIFAPKNGGKKKTTLHITSNATNDKNPFKIRLEGYTEFPEIRPQKISFTLPAILLLGIREYPLNAVASSALPVNYEVLSGPAAIEGNILRLSGIGVVKVRAHQAGNTKFLPAPPVERSVRVNVETSLSSLINLVQIYDGKPKPIEMLNWWPYQKITYKVGKRYVSKAPTNVGSYPVKVVLGNETKTATLLITKAPLFVQPFDQRKFIGQANPPLTFAYNGFLGADHAGNAISKAPKVVTKANSSSPGGLYSITASGGSSANYRFIYLHGAMEVESFAGGYETLLTDSESSRPVAKLSLTVSASSKTFSAKLNTPEETSALGFAGKLHTNVLTETATGTASLKKGDVTHLIHFALPISGGFSAEYLRNTAIIGTTTTGRKLLRLTRSQSLPYAGAHSALWTPAQPAGDDVPAGAGWAVTTVDSKGVLKFVGKLADGTRFTSSLAADIGTDPGYRMFIQPYLPARRGSYLTGAFALKEHPDLPTRRYVTFEDEADFVWSKATRKQDSAYRAGFGPVETRFTLDPWLPPVSAKGLTPAITLPQRLGLSSPANTFTARYSLFESLSFEDLPKTLFLNPSTNVVDVISPVTIPANVTKWKISLTPKNGAFVGSFELNDEGDKRAVTFGGLMRQPPSGEGNSMIGNGHFLLPALTPGPDDEIISGAISFER